MQDYQDRIGNELADCEAYASSTMYQATALEACPSRTSSKTSMLSPPPGMQMDCQSLATTISSTSATRRCDYECMPSSMINGGCGCGVHYGGQGTEDPGTPTNHHRRAAHVQAAAVPILGAVVLSTYVCPLAGYHNDMALSCYLVFELCQPGHRRDCTAIAENQRLSNEVWIFDKLQCAPPFDSNKQPTYVVRPVKGVPPPGHQNVCQEPMESCQTISTAHWKNSNGSLHMQVTLAKCQSVLDTMVQYHHTTYHNRPKQP